MDRARQKSELLMKLGALFGPLDSLVAAPADYDEQERAEIIARYCAEYPQLILEVRTFCMAQAGHKYSIQETRFVRALAGVELDLLNHRDLGSILPVAKSDARSAVDEVPVPRDSVILDANSPFAAYCKIRDLCETEATKEMAVVDAYMDATIFHRFLRYVRPASAITLVTSELKPTAGPRDHRRHAELLDVSRLFAQERDTVHYRLLLQPAGVLHDRWMRFDNKRLINLGGSSKDAGDRQYFTIAHLDPTPGNLQKFQEHIDSGAEYYGPATPTHT
jgi:hypothetical protein